MTGVAGKSGTNGGGKNKKKRTRDQRVLDKMLMVKLLREGWSKSRVAERLKIHPTQISYDWKQVLEGLQKDYQFNRDHLVGMVLAQYEEMMLEARDAWERSKADTESVRTSETPKIQCPACGGNKRNPLGAKCLTCQGSGEVGGIERVTRTTQGRLPDADYLRVIAECLEARRKMLGLDAPKELRIDSREVVIDWKAVAAGEVPARQDVLEGQVYSPLPTVVKNGVPTNGVPAIPLNGTQEHPS